MTLKKTLAVGMTAALALGLTACSSDPSSGSAGGAGDNYVLANGSEPQNPLIPANTNEVGGGRVVDIIYGGLVYYDTEGKAHNEQAESIELEGDRIYKITLKDGLKFSDGTPIKAENFVKTWNYAVANDQLNASFFEGIKGFKEGVKELEGLKVVDDKTFTVELDQPESDFPSRLGYSAFFALPDIAFDDMAAFGENPAWIQSVVATLLF
ncbi:ABC transporter substrate-binding protein [Corynebacterium diphtheriae]|nr:ABC transporter substrate-binding protein [Corynebacterium diphtheriae]